MEPVWRLKVKRVSVVAALVAAMLMVPVPAVATVKDLSLIHI